jgi:hypothetical protein
VLPPCLAAVLSSCLAAVLSPCLAAVLSRRRCAAHCAPPYRVATQTYYDEPMHVRAVLEAVEALFEAKVRVGFTL